MRSYCPDMFPATAGQRGTIEFDTPSGGQISVLGVRTTPPGTLTSVPALANVGTGGGAFAHIAIANGWKTSFVLVNTGASAAQAHLSFFDDDGNPLVLPLSSPQSGGGVPATASSVDSTINAGAYPSGREHRGRRRTRCKPDRRNSPPMATSRALRFSAMSPTGQEAVVPLESRNASSYILAFDNTGGTATGVAVSSSSLQAVSVPVVIRDDSGAQIGTGRDRPGGQRPQCVCAGDPIPGDGRETRHAGVHYAGRRTNRRGGNPHASRKHVYYAACADAIAKLSAN